MKRQGYFILTAVLALLIIGCGTLNQEQNEDLDRVIMTFQTLSTSRLSGLQRIEDAINEISREETGVEVSFRTVDANDSFAAYPLWLSQGERIDLMVLNYQDIQSYIKNGQILPLNSLLEQYGAGIQRLIASGCDLTSGTTVGGKTYGLSVVPSSVGTGGGLWVPKRYLDEANFPYEAGKIYTIEEISVLLARLKELYPDRYPLGQVTAGNTFSTYNFFCGIQTLFGAGDISGDLDKESGKLINSYKTGEYRQFLAQMEEWYKLGYIYPDAAYTGFTSIELIRSGEILSIPLTSIPGMISETDVGEEVVCLYLSEIAKMPGNSRGTFWVIPATCRNPEQAMKFLDLMYTDKRIVNLFNWGEEGIDYLFIDAGEEVIVYPEGITQETASYHNPLGLYGDTRLAYSYGSGELKKQQEEYTRRAVPIVQEYTGFFFDESPVSTEAWRVRQVIDRYLPVLECGCVDLEENYNAFLTALDSAGIDAVIAEKQRQMDAWLMAQ